MNENTENTTSSATSGPKGAPGSGGIGGNAGGGSGDAWSSARAGAARRAAASDRSRSSGWPWAITGIAIAFAAGLLANPWFEAKVRSNLPEPLRSFGAAGAVAGGASGEQLAQLEARLATLEGRPEGAAGGVDLQPLYERLARLEAGRMSGQASAAPAEGATGFVVPDTGLAQRLAALEGRVNTLDQSVVNAAAQAQTLQNAHAQLDSRLNQFTAETGAQLQALQSQGTQARTLLLLASVRRALASGQPMERVVEQLSRTLDQGNADITALQVVANGAPTITQLRQRLAQQKEELTAAKTPAAEGPWYARVGQNLKSLVQVRRTDEPAAAVPGDVLSQLAAMDQRLARDDVMGALAASQSLPQNARTRLQPLLADMEALANAREALSRLEAAALAG
ncbi:MAG TPA: hypothetical protein VKZ46_02495 [Pedomonas sp.]|nr:hypothetical protein [Pedomonas sp.]